jgi:hypothetical protein
MRIWTAVVPRKLHRSADGRARVQSRLVELVGDGLSIAAPLVRAKPSISKLI